MRTVLRWIGGGLLLVVLLFVLGTVVPRPFFADDVNGGKDREILLLSNRIHTDIALPVDDDLRRVFAELQEGGIAVNHPAAAYLVFGWGGRSFYIQTPTWADLKPMPVLRSFTMDSAVMHVDVTGDFPASLAGVKRLRIPREADPAESLPPAHVVHSVHRRLRSADGVTWSYRRATPIIASRVTISANRSSGHPMVASGCSGSTM